MLVIGVLLLCLGPILSSRLGSVPDFNPMLVLIPAVFVAAYLLPTPDTAWLAEQSSRIVLVYAYGSIASVAVAPHWAFEMPYKMSVLPGVDLRLHGLAPHANVLAAILLTYFLLKPLRGSARRIGRLNEIVVAICLLLTQSKTVWIAWVCVIVLRAIRRSLAWRGMRRHLALALGAASLTALLSLTVLDGLPFTVGDNNAQVTTLTGRTLVWAETVALWEKNPVFGYGPGLWGRDMRRSYLSVLGWEAPHAHSQFFQTLGESGLIGIVGLGVYALVLVLYAVRLNRQTEGVALALLAVTLVRGITETPLRSIMTDGNFFLHLVLFSIFLSGRRSDSSRRDEQLRQQTLASASQAT
jgi:exopolysaccharide production protein ExoQ